MADEALADVARAIQRFAARVTIARTAAAPAIDARFVLILLAVDTAGNDNAAVTGVALAGEYTRSRGTAQQPWGAVAMPLALD